MSVGAVKGMYKAVVPAVLYGSKRFVLNARDMSHVAEVELRYLMFRVTKYYRLRHCELTGVQMRYGKELNRSASSVMAMF